MAWKPICPTPAPPWSPCREGGFGPGVPYMPCRGGGGASTAQNDPHVALIILTTHMWGGGGVEEAFRSKFCVPAPLAATSVLTQNKGPGSPVLEPPV